MQSTMHKQISVHKVSAASCQADNPDECDQQPDSHSTLTPANRNNETQKLADTFPLSEALVGMTKSALKTQKPVME